MRCTFKDPAKAWTRWFAWRPVPVRTECEEGGEWTYVWREHVERRSVWVGCSDGLEEWEYRFPLGGLR